jgi:hypothetical protein
VGLYAANSIQAKILNPPFNRLLRSRRSRGQPAAEAAAAAGERAVSELKPELGALKLTAEEVAHQPRCFGYHAASFFIRDFGLGKIDHDPLGFFVIT